MNEMTEGHTVKRFDGELTDLHNLVLEIAELVQDQLKRAIQTLEDEDPLAAQEVIDRDEKVNALDVKADDETVIGLPENRILEVAESISPDLLVLGGNGRSTLSKLLKGSVAEDLVRKSRIPVHVVHTNKGNGEALPIMGIPRDALDPSVPDMR